MAEPGTQMLARSHQSGREKQYNRVLSCHLVMCECSDLVNYGTVFDKNKKLNIIEFEVS